LGKAYTYLRHMVSMKWPILMHPMAATMETKIPFCACQIAALKECHQEKSYLSRAMGGCNSAKWELDICLRENKQLRTERLAKENMDAIAAEVSFRSTPEYQALMERRQRELVTLLDSGPTRAVDR